MNHRVKILLLFIFKILVFSAKSQTLYQRSSFISTDFSGPHTGNLTFRYSNGSIVNYIPTCNPSNPQITQDGNRLHLEYQTCPGYVRYGVRDIANPLIKETCTDSIIFEYDIIYEFSNSSSNFNDLGFAIGLHQNGKTVAFWDHISPPTPSQKFISFTISKNWFYNQGIDFNSTLHPIYLELIFENNNNSNYTRRGSFDNIKITGIKNSISKISITPSLSSINGNNVIALTANGGQSYLWTPESEINCSTCQTIIVSPTTISTYCVSDPINLNCIDTACITLNPEFDFNCGEIFVPNVFSPNEDGLNDNFCVIGRCIKELKLNIYNRWGELVFNSTNQNECWDGKHNGLLLNSSVLVYTLEAVHTNGNIIKLSGNITLLR